MSPFRWGVLTLVAAVLVAYFGTTRDIPFVNEPYEVKAAFKDSSGIKKGSPVRVAGVDVGEVTKVEEVGTSGGRPAAVVTMAIKEDGRPLHQDATAKIRPRIFLEGNFFVDVRPGSPSSPQMPDGATIPVDRTANPVQLGEVLTALRSDTRRDLQTTLDELGRTEDAGGAKAFSDSLPDQEVAYRYSAVVAEALLGERDGDLRRWIAGQGTVAGALTEDRRALRDLVTNFRQTFAALADREDDLRAAVGELPTTLRTALPTLERLNAAFPGVRSFARASLPAIRTTGPAVDALLPLVRQLRGAVGPGELRGLSADLRRATPALAQVSRESPEVLEQLRLLSSCTTNVLVPYGDTEVYDPDFPATGPVYKEFPKSLVGLAGESRSADANGSWFKVLGSGGVETVSLGNGLFGQVSSPFRGVRPTPQKTPPPLEPTTPCETQEPPVLRSDTGAPPASRRIDPNDPKVKARYEKARSVAIELENRKLKAQGRKIRVLDRDATLKDVKALADKLGLGTQLRKLTAKAKTEPTH
ncbi:MlaD family protein [Conexibacter sp. SYSU D00693]|uniref:MlaD family protein n=1 Tax=Conexibacter sp. SYSU D00693 TaxID=2812560 RepID=UPI00196A6EBE|nr:MlaD family protein [Conexibacter sp. SYSU D00693]